MVALPCSGILGNVMHAPKRLVKVPSSVKRTERKYLLESILSSSWNDHTYNLLGVRDLFPEEILAKG